MKAEFEIDFARWVAFGTGDAVAVDAAGSIYVGGGFSGTDDRGLTYTTALNDVTGNPANIASSGGGIDGYIVKYGSDGLVQQHTTFSGSGFQVVADIKIGPDGSIYAAGEFYGNTDFSPGVPGGEVTSTEPGYRDAYLAKLTPDLELLWVKVIGGQHEESGRGLAVDDEGAVFYTGHFRRTLEMDNQVLGRADANTNNDIYVMRFSADGVLEWVYTGGGPQNDSAGGLAIGADGSVIFVGYFLDTADFCGGCGDLMTSAGSLDGVLVKLDPIDGSVLRTGQVGGTGSDVLIDVAVDPSGYIYTGGNFTGTADANPGPAVTSVVTDSGSPDISLLKLDCDFDLVWAEVVGGSGIDQAYGLTVDRDGAVYSTGLVLSGTANLDPAGGAGGAVSNSGGHAIFLSKIDTDGVFLCGGLVDNTTQDRGLDVAVDHAGNAYFSGYFHPNSVVPPRPDFDPGAGSYLLQGEASASSDVDAFLAKYTTPRETDLPVSPELTYTFIPLESGSGSESEARDINENGQIVGSYYFGNSGNAVIWPDGQSTANVLRTDKSFGTHINDRGVAVGEFGPDFNRRGFIYRSPVDMTEFGPAPGYSEVVFGGINNRCQAVGVSFNNGFDSALITAEPWDTAVSLVTVPAGYSYTSGGRINDDGLFLGNGGGSGIRDAFISGPQGVFVMPSLVMPQRRNEGHGVNRFGDVVGYSEIAPNQFRAVHWTKVGSDYVVVELGSLGGNFAQANAINDRGVIVGISQNSSGEHRAFVYRNGAMTDLNTLAAATLPAGWRLENAAAINNCGQIVGLARFGGQRRAYLLNPNWTSVPDPMLASCGCECGLGDVPCEAEACPPVDKFVGVQSPASELIRQSHYANGRWVAVGDNGTVIVREDGLPMQLVNVGTTQNLNDVYYGNGLWVLVGNGGFMRVSSDALNWTPPASLPSGVTEIISGVHYAAGQWVAVGDVSLALHSFDGQTWTRTLGPISGAWLERVHYAEGVWIAPATTGIIYASDDGVTWTSSNGPVGGDQFGVHYHDGTWVIVGRTGTADATSEALVLVAEGCVPGLIPTNWNWVDIDYPSTLLGVHNIAGRWYAAGKDGALLTSCDALNWSPLGTGTDRLFYGVSSGNGEILVGGDDGLFLSSEPDLFAECNSIPGASVTDGLVAHFSFDALPFVETVSGQAVNQGGATFVPAGAVGGAIRVDEGMSPMTFNDQGALDLLDDITLAAWVKSDVVNDPFQPFLVKSQPGASSYRFTLRNDAFGLDQGTSLASSATPSGLLEANEWFHLAVSRVGNGTAPNSIRYFLNGQLVGTGSVSELPVSVSNPLQIGERIGNQGAGLNGFLDEIRIYDRVLTDGEVSELALANDWVALDLLPGNTDGTHFAIHNGRAVVTDRRLRESHIATVNGDGTLGPWTLQNTVPRGSDEVNHWSGDLAMGDRGVYVVGGHVSGGNAITDVSFALLDSNPATPADRLTEWFDGAALNVPRSDVQTILVGDYLYAVGGYQANFSFLSSVEYIRLGSQGELNTGQSWQLTSSLNHARPDTAVVTYGGCLYAIGGGRHNYLTSTVERARINSTDGSLGPWEEIGNLPGVRASLGATMIGDWLVVYGGFDEPFGASGAPSYYASYLGNGGELGGWVKMGDFNFVGSNWLVEGASHCNYAYWVDYGRATPLHYLEFPGILPCNCPDEVPDTVPPVITLLGADPQYLECPEAYTELGATAIDDRDGSVPVVIDASAVDPSEPDTYFVTYNAVDSAGNEAIEEVRTVVVRDTSPPVITVLGDNPLVLECGTVFVDPGATATDTCDQNLPPIFVDPIIPDTSVPGTYFVTYNVSDSSGNQAVPETRMVIVQDTIPPTITLLGDNPLTVECGLAYVDPGATAVDACDQDLPPVDIDASAVDVTVPGTYPVTFNVADASGNAAMELIRTVVVADTTPPDVACLDIVLPLDALGLATLTPDQIDGGSSDLCGPVDLSFAGEFSWVQGGGGGTSIFSWDWVYDVVVDEDGSGDIFVAGSLSGPGSFGSQPANGNGGVDAFVARVQPDGQVVWVQVLQSNFESTAFGVDLDEFGDVYVAAWYNGSLTVSYTGQPDLTAPTSTNGPAGLVGDDVALVKLDADGRPLWLTTGNGSNTEVPLGGVAVDGDNGVYISGRYKDNLTFTSFNSAVTKSLSSSNGGSDVFLAKYDIHGEVEWVKQYGGGGNFDEPFGMTSLSSGVVLGGRFQSSATFGSHTVNSDGGEDGFVARVGSTGDVEWVRRFGGSGPVELAYGVATDPQENVYVTGLVAPNANVQGNALQMQYGGTDVVFAKFLDDGTFDWATTLGGPGDDTGRDVAIDSQGNVVATGFYRGTAFLQGQTLTSTGDMEVFVARLNPAGSVTQLHSAGGGGRDSGLAVEALSGGSVVIGGFVSSGADFDGLSPDPVGGDSDFFLARLDWGNVLQFDCASIGEHAVELVVTDQAGNTASCFATVTIVDEIIPQISLLGDSPLVLECPEPYIEPGAEATDNCDSPPGPIVIDASDVNPNVPGTYTVTYNVSDGSGNAAVEVERSVIVEDTTPPVITLTGANPQVLECPEPYIELGATASDTCDQNLGPVVIDSSAVNSNVPGSYPVTYNVSDASGNAAAEVVRTVVVEDTTPPVITLNGSNPQVLECPAPYIELGATASDTCDQNLGPVVIDSSAVNPYVPGSYPVTYNVSDASGNAAAEVVRTVVVEDTTPPVITLNGSNPQVLECPAPYIELGATASDTCDQNLGPVVIDSSAVNPNVPGSYPVTYNVSDASGNAAAEVVRTVVVEDTTPPVITLNGSNPQVLECPAPYIELGATASDTCDQNLGPVVIDSSAVNPNVPGSYPVTYNVSDASGNAAAEVVRTVVVEDTTPPVITLTGANPQVLECPELYTELGASAEDECSGDLTASIVIDASAVQTGVPGSYLVNYTVSDGAGNETTVSRQVEVVDTTAPVITLNGGPVIVLLQGDLFTDPGSTVSDICDQNVVVSVGGDIVDPSTIGTYQLTYDAADSSGNIAMQQTRTVLVVPRFAGLDALYGCTELKAERDASIAGSLGSGGRVDLQQNSEVTGNVVSVEGRVDLGNDADVGGTIDAGGRVDLKKLASVANDVISGQRIDLKKDASIGGDAISGASVTLANGASVGGVITENAVVPPVAPIPLPVLALSTSGPNLNAKKNQTITVAPGSYRKLSGKQNSVIEMSSGHYSFREIDIDRGSELRLDLSAGPITVNVVKDIKFDGIRMVLQGGAASEVLFQVQGSKVTLGTSGAGGGSGKSSGSSVGGADLVGDYAGSFVVPNGTVTLEDGGQLRGSAYARKLHLKRGATVIAEPAIDLLVLAASDWIGLEVCAGGSGSSSGSSGSKGSSSSKGKSGSGSSDDD